MQNKICVILLLGLLIFQMSGCTVIQKIHKADELEQEVAQLKNRIAELEQEKTKEVESLSQEKEKEVSELEKAKEELAQSLEKEIGEYKAKLQMTERGLVITFLAELFFDSGKAVLNSSGKDLLQKVAQVLRKDVPRSYVAIEGYTDNEPIHYSGWKSNWELSCGRALAVLHYLIDDCTIEPARLSANGYGEYRPVDTNDTPEGRQKNRRVEIVILPAKINKVKPEKVN